MIIAAGTAGTPGTSFGVFVVRHLTNSGSSDPFLSVFLNAGSPTMGSWLDLDLVDLDLMGQDHINNIKLGGCDKRFIIYRKRKRVRITTKVS